MGSRNCRGFTLLEILLVVAAIAILAGIVIVAINPARQLGETRNAQRRVDVRTILSAVQQYQLQYGRLPIGITDDAECGQLESQEICATGESDCSQLTDLSELTDDAAFLTSMPTDPAGSVALFGGTGYMITRNQNGRVTVCAYNAELDEAIAITQ
jgi:prepilin-type N-terminal cleavage/methylation domain-containing protein